MSLCVSLLKKTIIANYRFSQASLSTSSILCQGGRKDKDAGRRKKIAIRLKLPWLSTSRIIEKETETDLNVLSKDERVWCCWHPPTPFPYEKSMEIPTDVSPTDSNLKIQSLLPVRELYRKKEQKLVVRELMNLTYTAKYRWFNPPQRIKRLMKLDKHNRDTKREREYL